MISKNELISLLKREFSTTLRVLKAYPTDKNDFKPHDRSSDVRQLTSTFVFGMYISSSNVFGEQIDRSIFRTYRPDTVKTIADDFEKEAAKIINRLEQMSEADLNKTVEFGGAKFDADDFILMILFDQIHHRGQLSVYVRMAGGKVPSIYGPSADDTSTNL